MNLAEQPNPTGGIDDRLDCLDHWIPPQAFYQKAVPFGAAMPFPGKFQVLATCRTRQLAGRSDPSFGGKVGVFDGAAYFASTCYPPNAKATRHLAGRSASTFVGKSEILTDLPMCQVFAARQCYPPSFPPIGGKVGSIVWRILACFPNKRITVDSSSQPRPR